MRFSAQGYATLNDRLSPDIAVLEGGYSIEKALPYVNVGIILAMAGMDYSHVKEPDYDPLSLRESDEILRKIEKDAGEIFRMWKKRDTLKAKLVGNAQYIRRRKSIFYDTDGISEQQEETVRVCEDCGGVVTIDSMADTGVRIFAVIVPGQNCPACRQVGEEVFEKTGKGKYQQVFFQDRDRDIFITK
jgi:hypothetical protein